jgi:hypothetical protein
MDLSENGIEPLLPVVMREDLQLDLFMFFEVYFLKRFENAVFEYCVHYFGHLDLLCDGFLIFMLGSFTPSIAEEVTTEVKSMALRSAGFLRYGLVLINDFFCIAFTRLKVL